MGRITRREISRLIIEEHEATRELTRELTGEMDDGFAEMAVNVITSK